jgi:hypothetical protein
MLDRIHYAISLGTEHCRLIVFLISLTCAILLAVVLVAVPIYTLRRHRMQEDEKARQASAGEPEEPGSDTTRPTF